MQLVEADLRRLFEATRAITSTLRLSELLHTVMRLATEVVRAEASSLLLVDEKTEELFFDIALGEKGGELRQIRLRKGEGIAGWVAENRKPAVVNDVTQDPRWTQKADQKTQFKTRAILAVPMQVYDNLVGVMEVINRQDGEAFNEVDQELLEVFASQAAIAIQNARLFESVRQEKEKMSTVFGEMKEGALLLDSLGRVVLSNPAARHLLGQDKLESTSWTEVERVFQMTPSWIDFQRTLGGAGGIELSRKEGPKLILEGVINQICSDRGEVSGFLVVLRDVTEERREAQLKKNFLSLVSHKLRTPLVAVRGFIPFLLEKPEELNAFQKQALQTIDRNSRQLAELVDKLLWFSRIELEQVPLTLKQESPLALLKAAVADTLEEIKSTGAVIYWDPALETLPMIQVDAEKMIDVFRNLIDNALKFNTMPNPEIRLSGHLEEPRMVVLSFQDNGTGIPPEEQSRIFQKFYQIESSFTGQIKGMGLGLTTVKFLVEAHGGHVRLQSEMGKGSTFILSIPIQATPNA